MKFIIVPKVGIRQKKTETLNDFRQRLDEELKKTEIKFLNIDYNPEYVINFLTKTKRMLEETEFEKNEGWLCSWCEYQEYCKKGYDYFMNLPENKRRNIENDEITRSIHGNNCRKNKWVLLWCEKCSRWSRKRVR